MVSWTCFRFRLVERRKRGVPENKVEPTILLHIILFAILAVSIPNHAYAEIYVEPSEVLVNEESTISAGRYAYYKLRLEAADKLTVQFAVRGGLNNNLSVWLLDLENFQKYQAGQQFSYYKNSGGRIQTAARYSFPIPKTNLYYLVLDNRAAFLAARTVLTYAFRVAALETDESRITKANFDRFYNQILKVLFRFEDFNITVRMCGTENAFSSPDITICRELINKLYAEKVPGAVWFVFFHEMAHSMLNLWGYPLFDNEDAADEFATVVTLLIQRKNMALDAAEWWADSTSRDEAIQKLWINDRHTISPQRARNIINWVNNADTLLDRWLNILAPNMRSEILEEIVKDPEPFKNTRPAELELQRRIALQRHLQFTHGGLK